MSSRLRFPVAATATVCLGFLATVGASGAGAATVGRQPAFDPRPGSAGIGDRLYPTLGNGGYDARHYDLSVRYASSDPASGIDGTVTLKAKATQDLSSFDLDFSGDAVGGVTVDGKPATFSRVGEELVITPARALYRGETFRVTVSHFTARPTVANPDQLLSTVFFITPDGSATSGQPNAMHAVYPSNDHPRDKASFTIEMNVPTGETAVANGVLKSTKSTGDGRTTWTYEQRQPMATELTQLAAGKFTVIDQGDVNGVPVRDVVPTRLVDEYRSRLAVSRSQITWMQKQVRKYPFDLYGSLVVDTELGFALETQTLSLYDTPWWTYPQSVWEPVMTHELAHQWFGDDVAPWEWSDVWLNEGHATWYELLYAADRGMLPGSFDDTMKGLYRDANSERAENGPVAQPLSGDVYDVFNSNVYGGGALVLYALRQKIGTPDFVKLERAWTKKYSGESASTADFIALASKVSGQDLSVFLQDWLYGTTVPPMPGHPDWVAADPGTSITQKSLPDGITQLGRAARR
nr:M1 family metallopeptidase [Kineosporia mesophila]